MFNVSALLLDDASKTATPLSSGAMAELSLEDVSVFGRLNRHRIISKKKTGFISGIQRTKDGDVDWDIELPRTCNLSRCELFIISVTDIMMTLLVAN